jgi:hypothetical protein
MTKLMRMHNIIHNHISKVAYLREKQAYDQIPNTIFIDIDDNAIAEHMSQYTRFMTQHGDAVHILLLLKKQIYVLENFCNKLDDQNMRLTVPLFNQLKRHYTK